MIDNAPTQAGVYRFINQAGEVIYVGKAKNLKNRLSSYLSVGRQTLAKKTAEMVANSVRVEWIVTESEFEAIILEAELIKKLQPKYNSQLKDDKSNLYIVISKDKYPIVATVRKQQLIAKDYKFVVGPFTSGLTVRKILRIIRRIVPFSTHLPSKNACLYAQMGLCSPCPSEIQYQVSGIKIKNLTEGYMRNIKMLKQILSGKVKTVKKELEKEMQTYSKGEQFEEAASVQRQLGSLEFVLNQETNIEKYIDNPNLNEDIRRQEKEDLEKFLEPYLPTQTSFSSLNLETIECYDCSHLAGTKRTASRVTFVNGEPDKSKYRHYKVKYAKRSDDYGSLKEVLKRRKLAGDFPDLMVIDGGKGQVSAALEVISEVPVIGLAKRFESVVIKSGDKFMVLRPEGAGLRLLQRLRDEAHRFARRYHHMLVKKSLGMS